MGRSRTEALVRNVAFFTSPSPLFDFTSRIRPRGREFLGDSSSTTRTISPTSKLLVDRCHFCLSCRPKRNSLSHLRKTRQIDIGLVATSDGNRHSPFWKPQVAMWGRTVVEEDDSVSGPRGLFGLRIPLLGAFDYRLYLTHESHKSLVIKDLFLKKGTYHLSECANAALPDATVMRACVGLKFHWILLWSRNSEITSWIHPSISPRSYFSSRTKFPPSSTHANRTDHVLWNWQNYWVLCIHLKRCPFEPSSYTK